MKKKVVNKNYQCPTCGSYHTYRFIDIREYLVLAIFLVVFIFPFLINLFVALLPLFGTFFKKCLIITLIWAFVGGKIMNDFVFSISTIRCHLCDTIFEVEE